MKKSLAFLTAFAAFSMVSFAETVSSANIVGYVKVDVPPAGLYKLVGMNFADNDGADPTLLDIFGTNQLYRSGVVTLADRVILFDPISVEYKTYGQKTDGFFYEISGSGWGQQTNPVVELGRGMWIKQRSSSTTTNTLYLSGNVVEGIVENQIVAGYQIISSPNSASLNLTNSNWVAMGARASNVWTLCDKIITFKENAYKYYGLRADGKWRAQENWTTGPDETELLDLGEGAWYQAKGSFLWTEDTPYSL